MSATSRPFLTATWRNLAILNYEAPASLLTPMVPVGTELDDWNGTTLVSMVGFQFLDTRVRGISIPFHRDFDEVNLRFYVRRRAAEGWRRGVVFVREIVPRTAVSFIARWLYHENYITLPMRRTVSLGEHGNPRGQVEYGWRWRGVQQRLCVESVGGPEPLVEGALEEFITEHYWGYTRRRDGRTAEYRVEHPRWMVRPVAGAELECDAERFYGPGFGAVLGARPHSALLAEGSEVAVYPGGALDE